MYVWAMRDKQSEWQTVRSFLKSGRLPFSLLVEAVCEPFISIRDSRIRTPDEVMGALSQNLAAAAGATRVWVDFENLTLLLKDRDIAEMMSLLSRNLGIAARDVVPVLRTSSGPATQRAALSWSQLHGTGICLRVVGLSRLDDAAAAARGVIDDSGHKLAQIDLVTDAADLPRVVSHAELRAALPFIAHVRSWSHLAGSFPSSVTHLSPDEYEHSLERSEWSVWKEDVLNESEAGRAPDYGDYATQSAVYGISPGFAGSPTVRYSTEGSFKVLRGRGGVSIDFSQFVGHARFLQRQPYFREQVDTPGDLYVDRIATGTEKTGNLSTWRVASLQRHVALASTQAASLQEILQQRELILDAKRMPSTYRQPLRETPSTRRAR